MEIKLEFNKDQKVKTTANQIFINELFLLFSLICVNIIVMWKSFNAKILKVARVSSCFVKHKKKVAKEKK